MQRYTTSDNPGGRDPAWRRRAGSQQLANCDSALNPQPADDNRRVAAVSYAHEAECREHANVVDAFCRRLHRANIRVVRDSLCLGPGERISSFMHQLAHVDPLFVFLSDAYLKSEDCMHELLMAWRATRHDPESFCDRVKVGTLPGTDVHTIAGRLDCAGYWKMARVRIESKIDEYGMDVLGPSDLLKFRRMVEFSHNVDEILAHVVDILQARDFEAFADAAVQELESRPVA